MYIIFIPFRDAIFIFDQLHLLCSGNAVSDLVLNVARALCVDAELIASLVDLDAHLDSRPPTGAEEATQARTASDASTRTPASAGPTPTPTSGEESGHAEELSDWRNPVIARAVEQWLVSNGEQVDSGTDAEGETETDTGSAPVGSQ